MTQDVPALIHVDHTWLQQLSELAAHHLHAAVSTGVEQDDLSSGARREADEQWIDGLARAVGRVLEELDFSHSPLVCDVGAGGCLTSALLAERGARVVATDMQRGFLCNPLDIETGRPLDALPDDKRELARQRLNRPPYRCDKVQAAAERLPFADRSFDIVFCRATLHHLRDLRQAVNEMSRILRVGGMFVACGEPFRSLLDSEGAYQQKQFDFLVGVNEHFPTLPTYLTALRGAGLGHIRVQSLHVMRSARLAGFAEWMAPGSPSEFEHTEFPPSRTLPLWLRAGGVNLVATKHRHVASPRAPAGPRLLDPCTLDGDREHLPEIRRALRRLKRGHRLPSLIHTGPARVPALSGGWHRPAGIAPGPKRARFTLPAAVCTLRAPPGAAHLLIEGRGFAHLTGQPTQGQVLVNDVPVGDFSLEDGQWTWLHFAVAPAEVILDVEIRTERAFVPDRYLNNGDRRSLGIAVSCIAVE
ncbi:MAG: class I SAM-dependent methyltransferase [Armatimonadota bacterium]|nr:MAG: class I SAM-dependent methyltransferase [Armatimonadota bacterium]